MKKSLLYITFCFTLLAVNAQEERFGQAFLEANTLMEESQYNRALKIWMNLYDEQPNNYNVNFKIGKCYINSANNKKEALDYLVKAIQSTTTNYDPFSSSEKKAPVETHFFLARAYHINYELDEAIARYNTFKAKVSDRHYLYNEVDRQIRQCLNAKEAIKNPVNISAKNMGSIINSAYADYSPVMSIGESTIYYTSRRLRTDSSNLYLIDDIDGKYFEDIYFSDSYLGEWTTPKLLEINTDGHEAVVNISVDGQTLFIYKDDEGDGNLYTSSIGDSSWSSPKKLGSNINLESKETHAHSSPDGNTLYFVSDRKKGNGGQDIYKCNKLPTGEWAKAQNLGNTINTPYDEDGIFIHPSGKTMYFSSKGHKSIGGYDIFYSTMDDLGNWGPPVNIGYPINSTDNDVFFVTSADGKRGYYSSFQEQGYGEKDIYQMSLEESTSEALTLLTGYMKIEGQNKLPKNASIIVTNNETGEIVGKYVPRKRDGKFSIILPPQKDYHIVYSASTYKQEEDLFIPPISAYQEISRNIDLGDIVFKDFDNNSTNLADNGNNDKGETNKPSNQKDTEEIKPNQLIGNVIASYQEFFGYNKKDVNTSEGQYINMLNKAIEQVNSVGKVYVDIESSASKVPTKTYGSNKKLAQKRAAEGKETLINSLIKKGVEKDAIIINDVKAEVKGPRYKRNQSDPKTYQPYQYVIIKIR